MELERSSIYHEIRQKAPISQEELKSLYMNENVGGKYIKEINQIEEKKTSLEQELKNIEESEDDLSPEEMLYRRIFGISIPEESHISSVAVKGNLEELEHDRKEIEYKEIKNNLYLGKSGLKVRRVFPSKETRNRVVEGNYDLCDIYAKMYYSKLNGKVSYDDLFQTSAVALVEAANYYVPVGPAKFRTFASKCIENKINNTYIPKRKKIKRKYSNEELLIKLYVIKELLGIIKTGYNYHSNDDENISVLVKRINITLFLVGESGLSLERISYYTNHRYEICKIIIHEFNEIVKNTGIISSLTADQKNMLSLVKNYRNNGKSPSFYSSVMEHIFIYARKLESILLYNQALEMIKEKGISYNDENITKMMNRIVKDAMNDTKALKNKWVKYMSNVYDVYSGFDEINIDSNTKSEKEELQEEYQSEVTRIEKLFEEFNNDVNNLRTDEDYVNFRNHLFHRYEQEVNRYAKNIKRDHKDGERRTIIDFMFPSKKNIFKDLSLENERLNSASKYVSFDFGMSQFDVLLYHRRLYDFCLSINSDQHYYNTHKNQRPSKMILDQLQKNSTNLREYGNGIEEFEEKFKSATTNEEKTKLTYELQKRIKLLLRYIINDETTSHLFDRQYVSNHYAYVINQEKLFNYLMCEHTKKTNNIRDAKFDIRYLISKYQKLIEYYMSFKVKDPDHLMRKGRYVSYIYKEKRKAIYKLREANRKHLLNGIIRDFKVRRYSPEDMDCIRDAYFKEVEIDPTLFSKMSSQDPSYKKLNLEEEVFYSLFMDDYRNCLNELSNEERQIINYWFDENGVHAYTSKEIADLMNMDEDEVNRLKKQAIRKIRKNPRLKKYQTDYFD